MLQCFWVAVPSHPHLPQEVEAEGESGGGFPFCFLDASQSWGERVAWECGPLYQDTHSLAESSYHSKEWAKNFSSFLFFFVILYCCSS